MTKEAGEEFARRLDVENGEKGKERYIETSGRLLGRALIRRDLIRLFCKFPELYIILAKTPTNVDDAFHRLVELTHRHLKPVEDSTPCCTLS